MGELVHADIFFFITSLVVVVGGLLFTVLLVYGILIFKDLRAIAHKVRQETELIAMDIDEAREHIKRQGAEFSSVMGFLKGIFGVGKEKPKRNSE